MATGKLALGGDHEGLVGDGCELAVKIILMLKADLRFEVVAGDHKVSLKKDANVVVNGCGPGNQLWVILVKLVVYLVDIPTNSCRVYSQRQQVVMQGLSDGNNVDGGQTQDNLIHDGSILHPIEGVLISVGE